MDWKRFDRARSSASPIELDLIESYAQGKIKRRDFVKRGTVIGLSMPFMGGIIAACGSDDDGGSSGGSEGGSTPAAGGAGGDAGSGGTLVVGVQQGDSASGLDPVNMLDLGTYCVVSQSLEYLVGLGPDGDIGDTGLATTWSPNDDATVWTFALRQGVKWSDGTDFTSADVAATLDRLAEANNAGLAGVISAGSVDSSDPNTAVITLEAANGNFPYLVSVYNAQSLIAPAGASTGTTLDELKVGTGPWVLDTFDAATFEVTYTPNENWWNGAVIPEKLELRGFDGIGPAVTAMTAGEIDVIQQFSVNRGAALLNDDSFTVLEPPSANHRQVWFNTQQGQFTDKAMRQAVAWCMDREDMVSTLFSGRGEIGNDHPVLSSLAFYDADAVPQRTRDIEMAKQILSDAGLDPASTAIQTGDLQEQPDLAGIIAQNVAEAGFQMEAAVQSNSTFYGDQWCPGASESDASLPCEGSAEFGIVDYGHRPVPDVFFNSALKTGGVWNSSNFANDEFDSAFAAYQTSVDVEGQKTAVGNIQKVLWEEVPAIYPYFFNYLSGHSDSVSGVEVTSLGHVYTGKASNS